MSIKTGVTVCKKFEFAYAHSLPQYNGKCRRLHGHTGIVEIEIAGLKNTSAYPGMTVDFYDISKNVQPIIDLLDHNDVTEIINSSDEFTKYLQAQDCDVRTVLDEKKSEIIPPTSENVVLWLRMMLERLWPEASVARIRFWESSSSYAEWKQ